jgi:hypothetical protein
LPRCLRLVGGEIETSLLILTRSAVIHQFVDHAAHLAAGGVEVRRHLAESKPFQVFRE